MSFAQRIHVVPWRLLGKPSNGRLGCWLQPCFMFTMFNPTFNADVPFDDDVPFDLTGRFNHHLVRVTRLRKLICYCTVEKDPKLSG